MRVVVVAAAISLSIVGLSLADDAKASIRRPTNIPAQSLVPALKQLAHERGIQVVFQTEVVGATQTHGAAGELTTTEALTQLLEGTNLVYRYLDENTVTIVRVAGSSPSAGSAPASAEPPSAGSTPGDSQKEGKKSSSSGFLLAQVAQGAPASATTVEKKNEQASDKKPLQLEEVLVTAQKREQRAFDVPISIIALSADELQKREVTSIDDLSLAVPGLFVNSSGSYYRQIMMRGVSNVYGQSSLIGLYLDEASVTSAGVGQQPDLRTYDLERVEVLRGPQGTLYGEGSVGGTIRFITKNPQLDRFAMNADIAALFTQDGAPGQRLESVVNVPVIENQLGFRIAGTYDHEGGWIDQPAANRKNFNDQNLVNVRVKGLWQFDPQFAVNAMAVIHRNDAPPNKGEDANGNYTQVFNLTTTPGVQDNYNLYSLTLTYDFPAARLLSATDYINQDNDARNVGLSFQLTPPGTPAFDDYFQARVRSSTSTEELRLTSLGSGPWQWTIGGFYRHARFDSDTPAVFFGLPGPPGTPLPLPFSSQSSNLFRSWAAFGDTSYKLTEKFTLGTGLRYFSEKQEATSAFDGVANPLLAGTFHALNPRFYALYKLSDQVNTYASAAKGFRSGGFNALNQPTYGPESVWTYELGTKMLFGGGRLGADAALFFSNYTDYQIVGIVLNPPQNITSNAGDARIKGIEWAVTWRAADQWSLGFNGDYVDSKFTSINATDSAYVVGDPLDLFPKYEYTLSVQRDFRWNGRRGFARLDYNQQGRSTFRNRNIAGPTPWYYSESDVINMLNFNANLQWNESLSLGVFAQNLLNDRGFITTTDVPQFAPRSRPRTFGIEFGVKF